MKKTVILKNLQALPHTPQAINGQSGIVYGHAQFDPEHNAHVFRLPYEEWVGPKGKDIASRSSGPLNKYHVLFETEDDGEPSDRERDLKARLDATTRQLQELQREHDRIQRASLVDQREPADRRITESVALAKAAEDSQLARDIANAERGITVPKPIAPDGAPLGTVPPTNIEEANAGFLIAAKKGIPLEETRVEENHDTGALETVKREATPVASGVPSQPVGETQVTPFVAVHETRTPTEPAEGKSPMLESIEQKAGEQPVNDEPSSAPVQEPDEVPVYTQQQGETDSTLKPLKGDLETITDFRELREIAKSEDVPEIESHTTVEDLKAAILLNREEKLTADAGK